jgi:hypothetical protein
MIAIGGCMKAPAGPADPTGIAAPSADSVTLALWRMDEPSGTRVGDSGPFRLEGVAGRSVTRPFGRFGGAAGFEASIESFVFVPYNPALETGAPLTVEAWVRPTDFGDYEDTPIAARWTEEANKQSWIFSLAGRRFAANLPGAQGPGLHRELFPDALAGKLLFAYQPQSAGPPRAFVSTRPIELGRWTHVAVVFDGQVVRFVVNGELDSQFASLGRIRASEAPVLMGNYFDVRQLTGFGGDLRPDLVDETAYYAFRGQVDELRVSAAARTEFPTSAPR